VTTERLLVTPAGYATNTLYAVTFPKGDPVRLRDVSGAWSDYKLGLQHQYEIVVETDSVKGDGARITTVSYEYYIFDSQDSELLAFHWAPGERFQSPDHPHIHVTAPLTIKTDQFGTTRQQRLDRIHIPTGRISLESVMRLLIAEFGIKPVFPNWSERLNRTEAVFRSTRTRLE
jgi:hypothetical protein